MPGITNEDIPEGVGPNASMQFGEATNAARMGHELASTGPAPQQPGQPAGPGGPGSPTPSPGPPGPAAQTPVQPPPSFDPSSVGRLNPNQMLSAPVQPDLPWATWLKSAANHPQAGPALRALADMIQNNEQKQQSQPQQPQQGGPGAVPKQ